ncbi:hypothetical protein MLD38_023644 [Melastoma candidum]|uniref:Uncharacterized protein n=1 Tax=Melastoma candidum TaxID=119954 RepID=A0ACB9NQ24_9MYRT|nr:hypothetical protein MLD38_023644 [Melastoma candidum]
MIRFGSLSPAFFFFAASMAKSVFAIFFTPVVMWIARAVTIGVGNAGPLYKAFFLSGEEVAIKHITQCLLNTFIHDVLSRIHHLNLERMLFLTWKPELEYWGIVLIH